MEINPVDPRDVHWEVNHPAYRVYFWSETEGSFGGSVWTSSEYEVTGADLEVTDVLSWAREHGAQSAIAVVYALVDRNDGSPGHIRLAGYGPNLDARTTTSKVQPEPGEEIG